MNWRIIEGYGSLAAAAAKDVPVFKLTDCDRFEPDTQVLGNTPVKRTASYHLRPFDWPLIEGFVGGEDRPRSAINSLSGFWPPR